MEKHIKQLFIDFIGDRCSDPEIERVKQLLNEGTHEQLWREAIEESESSLAAKDYSHIDIDEDWLFKRVQKSTGIKYQNAKSYAWIGYAATFLILMSIGFFFIKSLKNANTTLVVSVKKPLPPVIKTAAKTNVHKWIKLPDGSSVQLNNDSHLDYPQTFANHTTREVALTGEAYFDIKHDAAHPFIIHTGKIKTTVLGTAFNISAYKANKDVTVTVTRGRVMVQEENKTLAILTSNQQLAWNNAGSTVKTAVDAKKFVAWKQSDIIMDDITLAEAAKMITAHYGIEVHFMNEKVKNCRFTAAFLNSNEIGQVLNVLGDITGATLTLKNNSLIIDGPGC